MSRSVGSGLICFVVNCVYLQRAVEEAVRKQAPSVRIFLDHSEHTSRDGYSAGDTVQVHFVLTGVPKGAANANCGGWSDDDTVCLVCTTPNGGTAAQQDGALYTPGDQRYEAFEYTDAPKPIALNGAGQVADKELLGHVARLDTSDAPLEEKISKVHKILKDGFIGKVTMRLPTFGSVFHVSYVRTVTLPANSADPTSAGGHTAKVVQRRVRLATTAPFTVRAPVYGAHPDAKGPCSTALFHHAGATKAGGAVSNVRRRGAAWNNACAPAAGVGSGSVASSGAQLEMWAEDMCHIRTLTVTTRLCNGRGWVLTRCMAWAVDAQSVSTAAKRADHSAAQRNTVAMRVYVEVDAVTLAPGNAHGVNDGAASAVTTLCGVLNISDSLFLRSEVDLRRATVHVDERGYVLCRFPYSSTEHSAGNSDLRGVCDEFSVMQSMYVAPGAVETTVRCAFCQASILQTSDIQECRPLPSGLLDNVSCNVGCCHYPPLIISWKSAIVQMMHDFICCEELSSGGLTAAELDAPLHTLLYGEHYLSTHPSNLHHSVVAVHCKTVSTPLDLLTGHGGTLATAPVTLKGLSGAERAQKCVQALKSVINIDTCMIRSVFLSHMTIAPVYS
jgi:hypothetical protein